MSNSLILSTFNTQLTECLEDISTVYNTDKRFIKCKLYVDGIKKANPSLLIKSWKKFIADKYAQQIEEGNFDYFLEKDYSDDLSSIEVNSTIESTISELRGVIRDMSEENKIKSLKYVQNLTKLSKLYV
jgi:hypothetical protein